MVSAFDRVNYPGVIAGILALVSIFEPWWGVNLTVLGSSSITAMYGLFGPPTSNIAPLVNNEFNQMMANYTPIILALALITMGLSLLGSFAQHARPLAASIVMAIATAVGFSFLVSESLSSSCGGNNCIRDLTGSRNFGFNTSTTWGFQTGFYLFLAATIIIVVALTYHQTQSAPKK